MEDHQITLPLNEQVPFIPLPSSNLPENIPGISAQRYFTLSDSAGPSSAPLPESIREPISSKLPTSTFNKTIVPISHNFFHPEDHYADKLFPFLEVSGNKYKQFFFIALRFINPIIIRQFGSSSVDIPDKRCVVVDSNSSLLSMEMTKPVLFFASNVSLSPQCVPSERCLLYKCFEADTLMISTFHIRTLYVVTRKNPFLKLWNPSRKSVAFKALAKLFTSCVLKQTFFSIEDATLLRHFRRNKTQLNLFNTWYALAMFMTTKYMMHIYGHAADTTFGKRLYDIMKRSSRHVTPTHHPPTDFYMCHVTFCDTEPVGIACCIFDNKTQYVSTMVMTFTKTRFMDTQRMNICFDPLNTEKSTCEYWFPLYKDRDTWNSFGLSWYFMKSDFYGNVLEKCIKLNSVLDWLSIQKAEVYCNMKEDLSQVYEILTGISKTRLC